MKTVSGFFGIMYAIKKQLSISLLLCFVCLVY